MLKVDIDHEMLNSFFGEQRPEYTGFTGRQSLEEGFPFDNEDSNLKQMFLADTPLKAKRLVKSKKSAVKSQKRARQLVSKKSAPKPEWKKPQCLRLMVDITKLEPLSSKERSETGSDYSEEDFNELMSMVLDDGKPKIKHVAKAVSTIKPKQKKQQTTVKRSTLKAGSAESPTSKLKLKPKPKPKHKPKAKLPTKPKPKTAIKKKVVSAAKLKQSPARAKPKPTPKSKPLKRKLSKPTSKRKAPKMSEYSAPSTKLNGLPSPDSSATTFEFLMDDYDFSLDAMERSDSASKRRRTKWHDADTQTLWEGILRYGNNWSEIKNMLPGRTYYQVKDKGRRLLHHKGWKTGRSKNDACGAGEYAKNIAKSMLATNDAPRSDFGIADLSDLSLVNLKLPSVAANA